ncbi:hypothetical protein J6TS2_02350 [Heyndrickxia sporothermodurans]|nr:hypothetical protein J6TS2_02350 [Heyndrickxia sporothermodurans]
MKVKCIICDRLDDIDDDSIVAKRLRNRPIHTYMCEECHDRIEEKTMARLASRNIDIIVDDDEF